MNRQRGAALLVMLALVAVGMSWFTATRLAASSNFTTAARARNAEALGRAKNALVGHVAQRAAKSGENNPGRLPCPEAPWNAGGPSEGIAAGSCTLPAIGRLPWRTLGIEKTVDSAGEALWYAVSPGWALVPPGTGTLTIHSESTGQLNVDGEANAAVALIIAPGPAFNVQAGAGCAARAQSRRSLPPDVRDYLECANANAPADLNFASAGPAGSFNDQVVRVTPADLLPAIEAAIAHRTQNEIAPLLKGAYAGAAWGTSAANPLFPYAAPFANPATAGYQGAEGTLRGLLPFTYSQGCSAATDARCAPDFVAWNTTAAYAPAVTLSGVASLLSGCPQVDASTIRCTGTFTAAASTVQLRLTATANHVAMALRQLDPGKVTFAVREASAPLWQTASPALSGQFNSADSTFTIAATASTPAVPLANYVFEIVADIRSFADHPLLDASTSSATGWFVRNQWYRFTHYAIAPPHAASGAAPRACSDAPLTCLSITNVAPAGKQRAILILAGRALAGQARPSGNLADFLEFGNAATPAGFERQPPSTAIAPGLKKPFNDRLIIVDANP